ncbi:MAG: energy-coupling factor transporter transmembrane component T [Burkholderiales bacterium]|nr:energy-coupling factor transporter transmembrane component T [Burkholderiales bacterium]
MNGVLFTPGDTWLHRVSASYKLSALLVLGASLLCVDQLWLLVVVVLCTLFFVLQLGIPFAQLSRQLRPACWLILYVGLIAWLVQDVWIALEVSLRMFALLLAAIVVLSTTSITQVMAVVYQVLGPLHRIGWVDREQVALVLGLTLRFIPELGVQWRNIREAQVARGLSGRPFSMIVPMLMRTIQRASEIADAIDARRP